VTSVLFKVNHSRDFETSCDYRSMDASFVTSTIGSCFSIGSTAQPKMFVISWFLTEKFLYSAES